jgi:hypothetical protein
VVRPEKLHQANGWKSRRGKHAGAPRSRLRAKGEILPPERSVKSPQLTVRLVGGEQSCGPNVGEPLQPRDIGAERRSGRARHFGAKAKDCACWTGDAAQGTPGVWKAARSDSLVRNRRDPTQQPASGRDRVYKAKPKSHGAGRESEGRIVPGKAARTRRREGALLRSWLERGKCEGMVARLNNPSEKARELVAGLWRAAKGTRSAKSLGANAVGVTPRQRPAGQQRAFVHAAAGRPSVSRMPEIGTYGLNGGRWRRAA